MKKERKSLEEERTQTEKNRLVKKPKKLSEEIQPKCQKKRATSTIVDMGFELWCG